MFQCTLPVLIRCTAKSQGEADIYLKVARCLACQRALWPPFCDLGLQTFRGEPINRKGEQQCVGHDLRAHSTIKRAMNSTATCIGTER